MRRYKVTLDTNCLIDLEESRPRAVYVQRIVEAWRHDEIDLAVVAISASEQLIGKQYAKSFKEFERRLGLLGLDGIIILKPMCYLDMTFYDYCLTSDNNMINLEQQIHRILFPTIPFSFPKCSDNKIEQKWKNAKCDVQLIWAHIWHQRDIFVTSDKNFHKQSKRPQLIKLGAKQIETPESTAKKLVKP